MHQRGGLEQALAGRVHLSSSALCLSAGRARLAHDSVQSCWSGWRRTAASGSRYALHTLIQTVHTCRTIPARTPFDNGSALSICQCPLHIYTYSIAYAVSSCISSSICVRQSASPIATSTALRFLRLAHGLCDWWLSTLQAYTNTRSNTP